MTFLSLLSLVSLSIAADTSYWSEDPSCPDQDGTMMMPRSCTFLTESPDGGTIEVTGSQTCEVDVSYHYDRTWRTREIKRAMGDFFHTTVILYECELDGFTSYPSDEDSCGPCRSEGRL